MEQEIWKPVVGYEGLYEVSNLGRVKSVERYVPQGKSMRHVRERIKEVHSGSSGYPCVTLCKNRKSRATPLHRIIALAFIPNPENKPFIDHIDTDVTNYSLSNLRWVTPKENANNVLTMQHCRDNTYISEVANRSNATKILKNTQTAPKKVYQYTMNGDFIAEYESAAEASRHTGIMRSAIGRVCLGRTYSAGGYIWSFSKLDKAQYNKPTHTNAKAVLQYDRDGNFIKEWPSLKAVCEVYGSAPSNRSRSIRLQKFRGKFIWKFKE